MPPASLSAPDDGTPYGRGKVLRFVSDALKREGNRDTPPAMLLIGPRGSGKTVLLDQLESGHRLGAPVARIDLGLGPGATPTAVLLDIAHALSRRVTNVGKPKFPLLSVGLIAVNLDSESQDSPAEQLQRQLAGGRPSAKALADLVTQAGTLLPPGQQSIAAEAAVVLRWLVDSYSNRQLGEYLSWYASATGLGRGDGSRFGPLLVLYRKWRDAVAHEATDTGEEAERDVWRALCAALLQDLRNGFDKASLTHGRRTTNCLLLVDNVDVPVGKKFLETFAERRKQAAGDGQSDPLLVVAALGTRPRRLQPTVGTPIASNDDRLSYADWQRDGNGQRTRDPWYPVLLADLSIGDVRSAVTSHVLGRTWYDADYLHAVTGGHPASVRDLARRLAASSGDATGLLNRDTETGLLEMLCPPRLGERQLRAMAVFGATYQPRLRAAASVFRHMEIPHVNEMDIRDLFIDLMWAEDGDWLDIRPLPRLLLSRWLARDRSLWEAAHEGFLAYYRTQASRTPVSWPLGSQNQDPHARDLIAERYHRLALGRNEGLAPIAAALDEQLDERDALAWNAMLTAVTSAPNRLRFADSDRAAAGDQPRYAVAAEDVVRQLAGISLPGDRRRTVTRLIAARWLGNDRTFDPSRRLARLLSGEYYDLARLTDTDSDVFYREAIAFRQIARDWEESL